jgi:hypothetical protein
VYIISFSISRGVRCIALKSYHGLAWNAAAPEVINPRGIRVRFPRKIFGFNYLNEEITKIRPRVVPILGRGKIRDVTGLNPESDF